MKHFGTYNIFPTPVWHIQGTPQQLVDELYQAAYRYKENCESKPRSSAGGYQTPILSWDIFHPEGKKYIDKVIGEVIEHDFKIIEWWYNINGKGHGNMPHTHPGVDLAIVLYLTETDDLLHWINPFSYRKIDTNTLKSPKTKKGDIIIFPGDLLHFVKPNPREEDRISISMNLQLC